LKLTHIRDYTYLLVVAGTIIFFDQLTKSIVRANLFLGDMWAPWDWLIPYARIIHWKNYGAAFGIFQNGNTVFTILAFIVSGLILYYYPRVARSDWALRLAMGLQLGGAVGNLIDRLTQGYVTDYISVGNFPVFNIADASISTGVAVLVLGIWLTERKRSTSEEAPPPPDPESAVAPLAQDARDE
jgi:signal peptidase II